MTALALLVSSCGRFRESDSGKVGWRAIADLPPSSFILHNAIFQPSPTGGFTQIAVPVPATSGDVAAPLNAGTSPVAESSADGGTLVYSTWKYLITPPGPGDSTPPTGTDVAHPGIRALDLLTGVDRLLADGAISPVVSSSGDVAFVKGDRPDYYANEPFTGSIQMQNLTGTQATTLVGNSDNYRLVGWAGQTLLYYVQREGEVLDLYALTLGGFPRLLAPGAGVVAISPDGGSALVQQLGTPDSDVALLDVASGKVLQQVKNLVAADGTPTGALALNGDWIGNRVVAAGVTFSGLVYLTVDSNGISVELIRNLGQDQLPWGLARPRFSADAASVTGYAVIPPNSNAASSHSFAQVITCADSDATCTYVAPGPDQAGAAYPIVRAR